MLLSFAAVVIDLTRILICALTQVTVQPLIIAREVLLALSLGLRFLCYWLYVSEPPIGEPRPLACQDRWNNFLTLGSQHNIHSGSWSRWGVSGLYAKVALLATIPAITALQIIWRLIQRYHVYGAVYAVNVTLEIVVSLLLLLKLLVNTIPTSSITRSHTFGEYVFPILALMFNIGISVGNLILCRLNAHACVALLIFFGSRIHRVNTRPTSSSSRALHLDRLYDDSPNFPSQRDPSYFQDQGFGTIESRIARPGS